MAVVRDAQTIEQWTLSILCLSYQPRVTGPDFRSLVEATSGRSKTKPLLDPTSRASDARTLGFALAKGLVRGLARCFNPSSKDAMYCPFWKSVRCLAVDTLCTPDLVQMGVVVGVRIAGWRGSQYSLSM